MVDLLFIQFDLVQPLFIQSISSNPNLTYPNLIGLDENALDEKALNENFNGHQVVILS